MSPEFRYIALKRLPAETEAELGTLFPTIFARTFKGES